MPKMTRRDQMRLKYYDDSKYEPRTDKGEIDHLLEQTCDPDPKVRNEAARHLCPCHVQMNIPEVWDRILAMVDDPDPKVRGTVLHTLADGSPREREAEIVTAIESMYHDPDLKLRRRVRKLLAQYRRTGNINLL